MLYPESTADAHLLKKIAVCYLNSKCAFTNVSNPNILSLEAILCRDEDKFVEVLQTMFIKMPTSKYKEKFDNGIDEAFKLCWLFFVVDHIAQLKNIPEMDVHRFYKANFDPQFLKSEVNKSFHAYFTTEVEKFWYCFEQSLGELGFFA